MKKMGKVLVPRTASPTIRYGNSRSAPMGKASLHGATNVAEPKTGLKDLVHAARRNRWLRVPDFPCIFDRALEIGRR
jgi:hypothetical protein